jgi:aminoglycoside 6'-N-acetyltransferase I
MLENIEINETTEADIGDWLSLTMQLWPDSSSDDLKKEMQDILHSDRESGVIARLEDGTAIAFMNLSQRSDHVPGATQSPVAYLEGIYVVKAYRKTGVGRRLIDYAEDWAIRQGCSQFASDALLDNVASHSFHKQVGFREVERTVAYIKEITANR